MIIKPGSLLVFWIVFEVGLLSVAQGQTTPLRLVMLSNAAPGGSDGFEVVQGHLVDLPVELRRDHQQGSLPSSPQMWLAWADRTARLQSATVVFWINPQYPDQLFLRVRTKHGDGFIIRNVGPTTEVAENRFELMAAIVRSTIQTLLTENLRPTSSTAEPEERIEKITAPPPADLTTSALKGEETDPRVGIGVSYIVTAQGGESLFSHGAETRLIGYLSRQISLSAGYRIFPSQRFEITDLVMNLKFHPLAVSGNYRWRTRRNQFQLGLTAVLDVMTWQVAPATDKVTVYPDRHNVRLALSPTVAYSRRLSAYLWVTAAIGVDVYLYRRSLTVEDNGTTEVLFSPWLASPFFRLGVVFD